MIEALVIPCSLHQLTKLLYLASASLGQLPSHMCESAADSLTCTTPLPLDTTALATPRLFCSPSCNKLHIAGMKFFKKRKKKVTRLREDLHTRENNALVNRSSVTVTTLSVCYGKTHE